MAMLSNRYKVWIGIFFGVLVGLSHSWLFQQSARTNLGRAAQAEGASSPPVSAAEVLEALPKEKTEAQTAVDRVIAQARAKAEENSDDPRIWTILGDALMQKVRETADASYYGHAERAYRRTLTLDPQEFEALLGLAWVWSGRHEFEQSIVWANQAIALEPRNHRAYGLLGDAAVEMGDYDAAFEHYQKMLDLRPDISSYSRGAHLLFVTGNLKKARWLMQKAHEVGAPYAENTLWCRAKLASMYLSDGNLLAADQLLQAVQGKTAKNYHLLVAQGHIQTARKDYSGAIASYEQAAAIAPQHEVLVALGDLYRQTGDQAKANEQDALVESVHRLNQANGVRGDAALAQFYADHDRDLLEALSLAEEEYKTRKNVYVADILAWYYYKNGRYPEAKRLIKKAMSKRTPEALFLFHAGMIDLKLGDAVSARTSLYQAQSLNPNFSLVYAPLAVDMLQQLGGARPPAATKAAQEKRP